MIAYVLKLETAAQTLTEALSVEPSKRNHLGNQVGTSLNRTFACGDLRALHWSEIDYCLVVHPYYEIVGGPFAKVINLTSLSAVSLVMDTNHSLHQIGDVADPKREDGFQHCWD